MNFSRNISLPQFIRANKYEKNKQNIWTINKTYHYIKSSKIIAFRKVDEYWLIHWYGPHQIGSTNNEMHYYLVNNAKYNKFFEQFCVDDDRTIITSKRKHHTHTCKNCKEQIPKN